MAIVDEDLGVLQETINQYTCTPQLQDQIAGTLFNQAHHFVVTSGTFVSGNVTNNNFTSNQFMKDLLKETIQGAASDSSARDPPPRCHLGTRSAIIQRCLDFIGNCDGVKKMRWVFGAVGVGKSAIMQSVAEHPELLVASQASVFFYFIGRNDGTKAIITLSYQLAAKSEPYRQLIEQKIRRDPSLLQSSMAVQFKKFILEPFIHNAHLKSAGRVLIIIDGLDECNNTSTQLELLRLISDFCTTYPSSPLVWLIASRPEIHIASFFSKPDVIPTYEQEEVLVDSKQAREDTERFLRHELKEIKELFSFNFNPHSKWPEERDLRKLSSATGGLFAYAKMAVRYIGDFDIANPASQLSDILRAIDNDPMTDVPPEYHPLARLYASYARILSKVPPRIEAITRKLLVALVLQRDRDQTNFCFICNWLGITPDEAYSAINQLYSVLDVPPRKRARLDDFRPFHKSLIDYISDFSRSRFSPDIRREAQQLEAQCTFRVLNEAPDGIDFDEVPFYSRFGTLACGPGTGDKISLTWPADTSYTCGDHKMRLSMYRLGVNRVVAGIKNRDPTFQGEFCIRLLTTRFQQYHYSFPYEELCDLVFDQSRRHELTIHNIINQIPLSALHSRRMPVDTVKCRFRRAATAAAVLDDPWNSACQHGRQGWWEVGKDQDWTTTFQWRQCQFCNQRFNRQLEIWKAQDTERTVPTLLTSTRKCCMEIQCRDPEDGMSEWTYWLWYYLKTA